MIRPRKHDRHLPANLYHRHGGYYYVRNGKWQLLGHDLGAALLGHKDKRTTAIYLRDKTVPVVSAPRKAAK